MSQAKKETKKLPMLPGYTFTQKKQRYGKTQYFDKQAGLSFVRDPKGAQAKPTLGANIPRVEKEMVVDLDKKVRQTGSAMPAQLPAWVAYDRKVLRFYAYFKETVDGSAIETYRVRKCTVFYFLEDDSMSIAEPKVANSGIAQGVFVKRHRVPLSDKSGGFFTIGDLRVGSNIKVYGRVFRVYDCDAFTRAFYEENGNAQGEAEECPTDTYGQRQTEGKKGHNRKTMNPLKTFMEARLGKTMEGDTKRFLVNDGKVLRFFCRWDDLTMYGETMLYVLHYFLADGTVEVNEVREANSGRDHFPSLLKRQKLPKRTTDVTCSIATIGAKTGEDAIEYYEDVDFKCGSTVNVFSREIKVCACDKFTYDYYLKKFNYKQIADLPTEDEPTAKEINAPASTGFGSEEDSMGSFLFLNPKKPKKNYRKMRENDRKEMRFLAKFANPTVQDADRRFVVTFYLGDEKVGVYEKSERNSGFQGGKFLEKSRLRNPSTKRFFEPTDFFIGAKLRINKYDFRLMQADEFTLKFMEGDTSAFPFADINRIFKQLIDSYDGKSQQTRKVFRGIDKNKDGCVSYAEFAQHLREGGFELNEHEAQTLCRRFDSDRNGEIDFNEFAKTIERQLFKRQRKS